tara:strand:- start:60 stop:1796 length:1737 start_codon:yes stop_codon:yes gene_type:complete
MPLALDTECYPNFHLICIADKEWHTSNKYTKQQRTEIRNTMRSATTYGFNSLNYDMPIIHAALKGSSVKALYKMSKDIIDNQQPHWITYREHNVEQFSGFDHFDIKEPAPAVMISLKMYGARMHMPNLQDLPYDPHLELSDVQKEEIIKYCFNDIATTKALYSAIRGRSKLRNQLTDKYSQDLRSKSDAQIAEAIIKSEVGNVKKVKAPDYVKYTFPKFIRRTRLTAEVYDFINERKFELKKGKITLPDDMPTVTIGKMIYKFGVGGIHSTESNQEVKPTKNQILADRDVGSYYPAIILELGLYPDGVGKKFLKTYKSIFDQRLEAKEKAKTGDKQAALIRDGYKIALNGSYGKFGSEYSFLYSPQLLLQTTITGQLALLQLIEALHKENIITVSANTDGIVSLFDKDLYESYDAICKKWEKFTGFTLEETQYRSLHSANVNNYVAITPQGEVKGKGDYAQPSLMKSPRCSILAESVKAFLLNGTKISETIKNCTDLTKFIAVRQVKGGAVWKGQALGKVVRWYYSINGEAINYLSNGNKVATSDGATPIMTLPKTLPSDIDYDLYIAKANKMLGELC